MGVESIWQYSTIHDCICKVIETKTLWGDTTCCVWLPGLDSVVSIPAARDSLKKMRLHDSVLFYYSQQERARLTVGDDPPFFLRRGPGEICPIPI